MLTNETIMKMIGNNKREENPLGSEIKQKDGHSMQQKDTASEVLDSLNDREKIKKESTVKP